MSTDLTKKFNNFQKKSLSVFATRLNDDKGHTAAETVYNLATLPNNILVTRAVAYVITGTSASSPKSVTVKLGSSTVLTISDATSLGATTKSDVGILALTGGDLTLNLGAADSSKTLDIVVAVEYVEFEKNTGELTTI